MCPNVIFQILLPCSRPMMSHDVTCQCDCNVMCLFIIQKKIKKKKEHKINMKLNKRKEKLSVSKAFHNGGERWHSGRDPHPCVLCLSQTYLRLWVQFLSSPLCWVTA